MEAVFLFLLFIIMFIIIFEKFNVTTFYIIIISMMTTVIGNYLINDNYIWKYDLVSFIILFITYYVSKNIKVKKEYDSKKSENNDHLNYFFFYSVIFFTFYHFLIGGIPILTSNVETTRFDFTSSGLFGIPGRMVLYGLPFLCFYLGYFYRNNKKYKKEFIITLIVFVITRILGGFKGGFVEIIFMIVYLIALTGKKYSIKKIFNIKFIIIILVAYFFAFIIFNQYNSSSNYDSFITYILERLTKIQAEGGHYLLTKFEHKNYYFNDLVYFIRKYFKISLSNSVGLFPLEKMVSAALTGTPLRESSYIVSITTSAFNDQLFNVGYIISFLMTSVLGTILGIAERMIRSLKLTAYKSACLGLLIYMIIQYISKGNLIYYIINYILLMVLFYCIYFIGKMFKMRGDMNEK